ncbi:MAG: hypothetical protein ABI577_00275 [bacterium]
MNQDIVDAARLLGVTPARMSRELASAIRRSEPDAREVYGVINARRFVGRRDPTGDWTVSLEHRPQPWERPVHLPHGDSG